MRRWIVAVVLLVPFVLPARSWAWGCVGHQVVAYIASQNLNTAAAAKVADLLSDAKYGNYRSCSATMLGPMETFATWADDAKSAKTAPWHFWDIPIAVSTAKLPAYCGQGCVVSALKAQVDILRNPQSTRVQQQQALMFIIHLVGDAHQPMHTADNGDRGGNCVPVSFVYPNQNDHTSQEKANGVPDGNYSPNLHSIWDDLIIQTMTGEETSANHDQLTKAFADSIETSYASTIHSAAKKKVNLTGTTTFASWALASHTLAKPDSYSALPTAIAAAPMPAPASTCKGVSDKFAPLNEVAQGAFITQAQPVVKHQLALAGGRLAATLNSIWPS